MVKTVWVGADLVPTVGEGLGLVRDELVVSGAGREKRLRVVLGQVTADYDLVLVDCPPSLDQLTVNALTAADAVAVVTQSKLLSASGVAKLLQTIDVVRDAYNPALTIGGVIINAHESRTLTGQYWLEEISGSLTQVLHPPVPKLAIVNDAAEAGKGLDEWGTTEGRVLAEIYDGYLTALRASVTTRTTEEPHDTPASPAERPRRAQSRPAAPATPGRDGSADDDTAPRRGPRPAGGEGQHQAHPRWEGSVHRLRAYRHSARGPQRRPLPRWSCARADQPVLDGGHRDRQGGRVAERDLQRRRAVPRQRRTTAQRPLPGVTGGHRGRHAIPAPARRVRVLHLAHAGP